MVIWNKLHYLLLHSKGNFYLSWCSVAYNGYLLQWHFFWMLWALIIMDFYCIIWKLQLQQNCINVFYLLSHFWLENIHNINHIHQDASNNLLIIPSLCHQWELFPFCAQWKNLAQGCSYVRKSPTMKDWY